MATIDKYVYEEGIFYHLDNGKAWSRVNVHTQLVIPRALKEEVMLALHEEITSGHLSFEKTYLKSKARYYWTGMYTEIK